MQDTDAEQRALRARQTHLDLSVHGYFAGVMTEAEAIAQLRGIACSDDDILTLLMIPDIEA
jgi:hypothetical protein